MDPLSVFMRRARIIPLDFPWIPPGIPMDFPVDPQAGLRAGAAGLLRCQPLAWQGPTSRGRLYGKETRCVLN